MLTISKFSFLLSPSASLNCPPSTHPMITRSKYSLQALTTLCPSHTDLQNREPNFVHEALLSPHWAMPVQKEFTALLDNNIWSIEHIHSRRIPIG